MKTERADDKHLAETGAARPFATVTAAQMLDSSPDAIACFDAALRCVYANPKWLAALGLAPGACLGRDLAALRPFGDAGARLAGFLRGVIDNATEAEQELHWTDADGRPHWHVLHGVPVPGDGSAPLALLVAREITAHRLAEQALREREAEFRTLAENSPDVIIRYGLDRRAVYCNREIEDHVKVNAASVVGHRPLESAPPGLIGGEAYDRQVQRALALGESGKVDIVVPHPGGELRTHSVAIAAERDVRGVICGVLAVGRDVTDLVLVRQALADKEREFRSLAENAGDNIIRWRPDGTVLYLNPAMAALFGRAPDAVVGRHPNEIFPDGRFGRTIATVKRVAASGEPALIELRFPEPMSGCEVVHQIRIVAEHDADGAVRSVLGIGRDITTEVRQREAIETLARTDTLTGLANRQALAERAPPLLAAARRSGRHIGVMLLDLDDFKGINDSLGHSAGDELLCAVAQRLRECVRGYDLLVRLGGDELVLVLPEIEDATAVAAVAQKVHQTLAAPPMFAGGREVRVTASVGIALFPEDGGDMEALLAHADLAMYQAKNAGRGRTEYFRAELATAVRRRLELDADLRGACDGRGLELYMQPVVAMQHEGRITGAEALLRWNHPRLGLLAPDAFIPVAEDTGLIVPIGRWVLRNAAEAAVRWNCGRTRPLRVSVNISTCQFVLDDVADVVRETLQATGCEPGWLVAEITESLLLEDTERVRCQIDTLRRLGVAVAIDDFGIGYSALHYLTRLRVDLLKIDKCFVHGIVGNERGGELVKAFIAMARALDLEVVAEGVETLAQAHFLLEHGCRYGQGYKFGRPMPVPAFEALLAETAPAVPAVPA